MNCRPGDLVMIVRGHFQQNLGAMARVTRLDRDGDWIFEDATRPILMRDEDDPGHITRMSHSFDCSRDWYGTLEDAHLLPIRPGDLEDETPTVRELEAA